MLVRSGSSGPRLRLTDAVVLITGASAGIGAATAERFAAAGSRVLLHGRDRARTEATAERLGAVPLVADLSDPQSLDGLVRDALAMHGRVDVLVNNAGEGYSGALVAMTAERLRHLVEVDLVSAAELTRALLPGMLERRAGSVCFVTSVAGRTGVAGEAVYSAAKGGLDMFAEALRAEVYGRGVHVGVVVPGAVATGFFDTRGRPYDRRSPAPVPADRVAHAVVRTVVKQRAETWVPGWLRVAPVVRALAPGPYRALTARFGERIDPLPADRRPSGRQAGSAPEDAR